MTVATDRLTERAADLPPPRRRDLKRLAIPAGLLLPGIVVVAVALIWPFLMMLGVSFHDRYPNPTAMTGAHYETFLGDRYFLRITQNTFLLGIVVTAITAVVGYPVAWFLARSRSRWKHLVFLAVISPLLVSIVVRTIGWTIVLGNEGLINALLLGLGIVSEPLRLMQSFWSVVVGMVHVLLPFMILSIASVIGKIDPAYVEAAHTLGAHPVRSFLKITLPLSIQGIATGSVIVFCLTIGAYITPIWLGRGHVTTLSIAIYEQMIVLVDWPTGATASMILTAGTLVVLAIYGVLTRKMALR